MSGTETSRRRIGFLFRCTLGEGDLLARRDRKTQPAEDWAIGMICEVDVLEADRTAGELQRFGIRLVLEKTSVISTTDQRRNLLVAAGSRFAA